MNRIASSLLIGFTFGTAFGMCLVILINLLK